MQDNLIFVDIGIAPVSGVEYMSSLTWCIEENLSLITHHYFVDYPGAKELERQVTSVIGGNPLIRYSSNTVLKTFSDYAAEDSVIACTNEQQKQLLKLLINSSGLTKIKNLITLKELIDSSKNPSTLISFISLVESHLKDAKNIASSTFGNSL